MVFWVVAAELYYRLFTVQKKNTKRFVIPTGCLMIGALLMGARGVFGRYYIHRLDIISRGDQIRLGYYSFWGSKKYRQVPVQNIANFQESNQWVMFKIDKSYFNYLLDKSGKFENVHLMDHVLKGKNPFFPTSK
eukprot:TRINITY_DN1449_c0_g2_i2.p1 TRINITY_DN1449_c0_g2~~TRINITY_DN1449_c0_g2_i2.p1  ORF type:complete len:134 (+),score=17.10 TRINITY_DN1449_c0_g2_i2:359-760(+)